MERMLAGVSTRRYRRVQEPVRTEVATAGQVDVEVGGVPVVCRADEAGVDRVHVPPARRCALAVRMIDGSG